MKKIPQRTCLGCGEIKAKQELLRIVKTKEEKILVDNTGKVNGRGAYICKNMECLEKVIKSKKLEKNFEMKITEDIYEKIKEALSNEINK